MVLNSFVCISYCTCFVVKFFSFFDSNIVWVFVYVCDCKSHLIFIFDYRSRFFFFHTFRIIIFCLHCFSTAVKVFLECVRAFIECVSFTNVCDISVYNITFGYFKDQSEQHLWTCFNSTIPHIYILIVFVFVFFFVRVYTLNSKGSVR